MHIGMQFLNFLLKIRKLKLRVTFCAKTRSRPPHATKSRQLEEVVLRVLAIREGVYFGIAVIFGPQIVIALRLRGFSVSACIDSHGVIFIGLWD